MSERSERGNQSGAAGASPPQGGAHTGGRKPAGERSPSRSWREAQSRTIMSEQQASECEALQGEAPLGGAGV